MEYASGTEAPHKAARGIKPVIGISCGSEGTPSAQCTRKQVLAAGATPVMISQHARRNPLWDIDAIDALIVLGNNYDIDPAKYGCARHHATQVETDLARAAYEESAISLALSRKMPLLAICGGMQRLNVLGGGTLIQHVPDQVGDDRHWQREQSAYCAVQYVHLLPASRLYDLASAAPCGAGRVKPGVYRENSLHHQAVDILGKGFRVSAVSCERIIEAIEACPEGPYKDQFVMGIQWHPEFGVSGIGRALMCTLAQHAARYAGRHLVAKAPAAASSEGHFPASGFTGESLPF